MSPRRVVVVNLTRIGDLIQSGPFLRELKHAYPDAALTLVTLRDFGSVAERLPCVDDVATFDIDAFVGELDTRRGDDGLSMRIMSEFVQDRRLANADIVYNLSHTSRSALLCGAIRACKVLGACRTFLSGAVCEGNWLQYAIAVIRDRTQNPFHLSDIYRFAVTDAPMPSRLEFYVDDSDRATATEILCSKNLAANARIAVFMPGSSTPERRWPAKHFADLAQRLSVKGINPIVVGTSSEAEIGRSISSMSRGTATSICGATDLGTLAAILESAEVVIGNDTGTLHLAAAVGTKTIGLYIGPASVKETGPYGDGHIVIEPDLPYSPCEYNARCSGCVCAETISPKMVELAVQEPQSLANTAGVRVWETNTTTTGEFRARIMNRPNFTSYQEHVSSGRDYYKAIMARTSSRQLQFSIHAAQARSAVKEMTRVLESAIGSFSQIGQPQWIETLTGVAGKFPMLRPLASIMAVKWNYLPRNDPHTYLKSVESCWQFFANAVRVLHDSVPASVHLRTKEPHA